MDIRNIVIVVLCACLVWFGAAIMRLERFHYATMLNDCPLMATELDRAKWLTCVESKMGEQRMSPIYDLAYGLDLI